MKQAAEQRSLRGHDFIGRYGGEELLPDADAMLQVADEALSAAKAQGRNCVVEILSRTTGVT